MSFALDLAGGSRILYIMATEQEYGPALQAKIKPLITGVGPVEASISATRALAGLQEQGSLPDLVVTLGSAGSATLQHTGLYQVRSVSYRDMDASPIGFEKGRTPFLDLPAVLELPIHLPGIAEARLSTGADIVSGAAYEGIDADMVDMETYAILRVCLVYNVPLIGIRGVSDGQNELMQLMDWTASLHVIDNKLALAVDVIRETVAKGELRQIARISG